MRSFIGHSLGLGLVLWATGCSSHMGTIAAVGGEGGEAGEGQADVGAGGQFESSTVGSGMGGDGSGVTPSKTVPTSCIKQGDVLSDKTWGPDPKCPDGFDVPGSIKVLGAGTVLKIQPGTKLKFGEGAQLRVSQGAALSAVGTAEAPILFTGWEPRPGVWGGVTFHTSALSNEISHAIVEYGGAPETATGNVTVSSDGPGRLKLTSTTLRNGARFGLTVLDGASFTEFSNNVITGNAEGAARVDPTAVQQLAGEGNSFIDNGHDNTIRVENSPDIRGDVTWPNLSPAIYRIEESYGTATVKGHLTIEAGAVLEFVGHGGLYLDGGAAGLSAIGTKEKPIVFRGVDGSLWAGIGFCESSWAKNALEFVEIHDAKGPNNWNVCGGGATPPSVYVSQFSSMRPAQLRVKNVAFTNSDKDVVDVVHVKPSVLSLEGQNTGTGTKGALKVAVFHAL